MSDFVQNLRLERILVESAQYRTLLALYKSDPGIGPGTVAALKECFRADRDDVSALLKSRC